MKVIVLTINPYKEKDAVISAISENEFITFLARGIRDPKSKNAAINNPLCIADIELMDGNFKHPILKSSKQLFTPMRLEMDAKYLGSLILMNEIVTYLFPDEEKPKMFKVLEEAVTALKKSDDWLLALLIFMSHALRVGGFELEVNKCVVCESKKNIVAFSFIEGGFMCADCITPEVSRDLNKNQMLLLRKIFNSRDFSILGSEYDHDEAIVLFQKVIEFMEEAFGYHFKNLCLILD